MLYALICNRMNKSKEYESERWKEIKGEIVRLISNLTGLNGPVRPLIHALIGGAQPTMAGGPLSHYVINRGGVGGSEYEVRLSRAPHQNP